MLSLLLTLFISMFSCGFVVDSLKQVQEDNNIVYVEEYTPKYVIDTPLTRLVSVGDFTDSHYLQEYLDYLRVNYLSNSVFYTFNWSIIIPGDFGVYVGYLRDLSNLYGLQLSYTLDDIDFTCSKMNGDLPFADLNIGFRSNGSAQDRLHIYFNYDKYNVQDGSYNVEVPSYNAIQYSFNGITESRQFVLVLESSTASDLYNMFKAPSFDSYQYDSGFTNGYDTGYEDGKEIGFSEGQERGYADGTAYGRQIGVAEGLAMLEGQDTTASVIFEGIFDVGLLPVNVFLTIFNFEVFGINIAGIVSGLLTLAVVVIILRFLLGGKKDDK